MEFDSNVNDSFTSDVDNAQDNSFTESKNFDEKQEKEQEGESTIPQQEILVIEEELYAIPVTHKLFGQWKGEFYMKTAKGKIDKK